MSKQKQQSLLKSFFSGYFHEDWPCEAETPDAVIAGYLKTARPGDVRSLVDAIQAYSREFATDVELEERLFTELGCYYRPSSQGISARVWFEKIADLLIQGV